MPRPRQRVTRRSGRERGEREISLGPLGGQIGYVLRRAQLAVFADIIAVLAEFDLSPAKFSVLSVIHENPGARASDIGRALGIQKTNFVPLLDSLELRGLVTRKAAVEDRRVRELRLTPAGRALLKKAASAQARHEARLVARIGEHGRVQLLEFLERLVAPADVQP